MSPPPRALAALLAVCLAAPAFAKPSRAELKKARGHFRKGQALHDAGRLDDAIREYEEAYRISHLPDMLYNIGQVYRLRGDRLAAIDYYQRYLAAAPSGRGAPKARTFLDGLNREIEAEARGMRGSIGEEWRGVVQGASPDPYLPPLPRRSPPQPGMEIERPIATRDGGRGLRLAGLITGGAGVLLVGGGVLFAVRAGSLSGDLDDLGPGDTYDPSVVDDGRDAQRNSVILIGTGAAAVITGGVLFWLGYRKKAEPVVEVMPAEGGAVMGISGRF